MYRFIPEKKSPLLAFIKFEPTFLTGFLAVCLFAPVPAFTQEFRSGRQGEAGGRGVWGEFRPPSQSRAKSVRIFSNTHRHGTIRYVAGMDRMVLCRQLVFIRERAKITGYRIESVFGADPTRGKPEIVMFRQLEDGEDKPVGLYTLDQFNEFIRLRARYQRLKF